MCGIIGFFDYDDSAQKTVKGLQIMKNRGKDYYGISNGKETIYSKKLSQLKLEGKNVIGHCLHAMVSVVPQPLKAKGFLVANCEIYNWKKISKKYKYDACNDSEALLKLLDEKELKALKELDGVYAFCYWKNNKVVLCRDIIGIKPLWYSYDEKTGRFCFASEKKALEQQGVKRIVELNPRKILIYDTKTKKISFRKRRFFTTKPEVKESEEKIVNKLKSLIIESVKKRISNQKTGLLFSSGIDSLIIAKVLKDLGIEFTCYVAGFPGSRDVEAAEKAAKELRLKLKVKELSLQEVEELLKEVIPLIEDNNVVKAGVAATLFAAAKKMKEDGVKVCFSGSGADELFAGYERHKKSYDVNKECLSSIRKFYEVNAYRDDVITMNNNIELRVPFLDIKLVRYALRIPSSMKISNGQSKYVLRKVAESLGIPKHLIREKKAAQYGSRVDWAIQKLAKKQGKTKADYLRQFYDSGNVKLGVLFSSGKDSCLAMEVMMKQNYDVKCLITIKSKNPHSYMFHTPNIHLTELQAKAMNLPIIIQDTKGEKEKELKDLKKAIKKAIEEYEIEGIVTGALYSTYQRDRIEKICDELGLKCFAPLWHMDQEKEMRRVVKNYKIIFTSISAYGLDESWLGRRITEKDVEELVKLNKKYGINVAGEGGEFESLVLDAPFFNKEIRILDYEIIKENEFTARMVIKKAELARKQVLKTKNTS